MRNLLSSLIAGLLLVSSTSMLSAQTSKDQLYIVQTTKIDLSKLMQFEKESQKVAADFKTAEIDDVKWAAHRMEDLTYSFGIPIENMAQLDKYWASAIKKLSAKNLPLQNKEREACITEEKQVIVLHKKNLSYHHPNVVFSENNYRVWTYYQFKKDADKVALAKAYKTLCEQHNIVASYSMFFGLLGTDANTVAVQFIAKDEIDYVQQQTEMRKKMGEEGQQVVAKVLSSIEEMEVKRGVFVPSISYYPAPKSVVAEKED